MDGVDEELGAAAVGLAGVGHREGPRLVGELRVGGELVLDGALRGAAGAGAGAGVWAGASDAGAGYGIALGAASGFGVGWLLNRAVATPRWVDALLLVGGTVAGGILGASHEEGNRPSPAAAARIPLLALPLR